MSDNPAIAIDTRSIRPEATGVGRSVRHLVEHLVEAAPRRRFVLFAAPGTRLGDLERAANVEVVSVPCETTDHPGNERLLNLALPRLLRRHGAGLFHGPAFHAPWRKVGVPVAVTVCDLSVFDPRKFQPLAFRLYLRWMIRFATRNADRIIAISETTARRLVERFDLPPERVVATPLAAEPGLARPAPKRVEAFRQHLRLPERYVLGIGTLEPRKNPVVLAEALARMPEASRPLLVWAGADGRRSQALQAEMTQRLGSDGIRRLSRIGDEDLALLRAGADVLAWPSWDEGFGLPILDAMSVGVPVVCSDIAVHREVAGEAALFADPADPAALAERLGEILEDPAVRRRLVDKGFERAKGFGWDKTSRRVLALYDEMLAR
jgi:glycosyltransferase involved in cell wall biosynthesis